MFPEEIPTPADDALAMEQQVARLQALLEVSREVHAAAGSAERVLLVALRAAVRELEVEGAAITCPPLQYGTMPAERAWADCPHFSVLAQSGIPTSELIVNCSRTLTLSDEDFLEGLVLQTAVALHTTKLHERDMEWARVQQDLHAARALQRSLLPSQMPKIEGYDIAVRSSTCYEVGGDYADLLPCEDGSQLIIIADVAGKGLASAIVSTAFRAAFRAMATAELPLIEIAERLNLQHWSEGPETRRKYVTALLARLHPKENILELVNAGHNPALLILEHEGRPEPRTIDASGPPVGLLPYVQYAAERHELPAGSRLLLYTDGLSEVFRGDKEFGQERLFEQFFNCAGENCEATLDTLWRAVFEFSGGGSQADDMTAIALCRWPCGAPEVDCK